MLTVDKVKQKFNINELATPAMIIDLSIIKDKFRQFAELIPGVKVFYSVKTNAHKDILDLLNEVGSGFEIASLNEFKTIKNMGVTADRIITGNTLKAPEFIEAACNHGVNYFAYDSQTEVDKLVKLAPGANVALRIAVDNTGSEWPLSKKFGAQTSRALDLLKYAKDKGLNPNALTFHVGSQCMNPTNWSNALITIAEVYNLAKKNGFKIEIINLGGGFPSRLTKDIPEIDNISDNINKTIKEVFNGDEEKLQIYIEPGRGVVGEASLMVSTVIAKADRGSEKWLILDVGVYNGLLEAVAGIEYEFVSDKEVTGMTHKDDLVPYNIGGPTCDSWDTITNNYYLPKDLKVGDKVYILNTGAYTLSEVTVFNGFDAPKVYIID